MTTNITYKCQDQQNKYLYNTASQTTPCIVLGCNFLQPARCTTTQYHSRPISIQLYAVQEHGRILPDIDHFQQHVSHAF